MTSSVSTGHAGRRGLLVLILLASIALKLLVVAIGAGDPGRFTTNDSSTYLEPAAALLSTGAFAESPEHPERPETLRTPGYPVFIAAVYAVFGPGILGLVVAQAVLSLGTLVLVFGLAAELWHDRRAGLAATILLALDLASFVYALSVLSETLFAFLLTAALYGAVRFRRTAPGLRWCALFGLSFAAAVLVRPIAYYLFGPCAVWAFLACRRRQASSRRCAVALAVFAVPFLAGVGGWKLRNELRTGVPVLSRVTGFNMLFFRGAAVVALRDRISFDEARRRLGYRRYTEIHPEAARLSPEELSARWFDEGLALVGAHPVLFARTHLRPLAAVLFGTPEHALMRMLGVAVPDTGPMGDLVRLDPRSYVERWIVGRPVSWLAFALLLAHLLVLTGGAAYAWVLLLRDRGVTLEHGGLALAFLYLLFISAGPEAYSRFRVPLAPILSVYAGAALTGASRRTGPQP